MRRNLYFRLTLLLVAILLVGCSGGSGSSPATTEINSVLNQYQSGMKKMNAESIANLFVYPLELDGEVLETKEQAIFMYSFLFGMIHILLLTTLFDLKLVALFGQEGQEVLPSRFS